VAISIDTYCVALHRTALDFQGPERFGTKESTEFIELIIVLLVTIAAVVLGLQTTSVKSAFVHPQDRHIAELRMAKWHRVGYGSVPDAVRLDTQVVPKNDALMFVAPEPRVDAG
jgi:hypothetical protein